jgi:hypothetical protein
MIKLKYCSLGVKQQSLTQKVTCSPIIKLKYCSLGVKQQSLTHSLTQKVTCSPIIKLKYCSLGVKQQSFTHSYYIFIIVVKNKKVSVYLLHIKKLWSMNFFLSFLCIQCYYLIFWHFNLPKFAWIFIEGGGLSKLCFGDDLRCPPMYNNKVLRENVKMS